MTNLLVASVADQFLEITFDDDWSGSKGNTVLPTQLNGRKGSNREYCANCESIGVAPRD